MGLETATYIPDLDKNNPTPADLRRQGDDHLRMIKEVLLNTFPNLDEDGTVTPQVLANAVELGYLVGVTSNIQDQLDAKLEEANLDLSDYAKLATEQEFTANQRIRVISLGTGVTSPVICNLAVTDTFVVSVAGTCAISVSNLQAGQNFTLKIYYEVNGPNVTLPSQCKFAYGEAPSLTKVAGTYDVISGKVIANEIICGFLADVS